MRTVLFVALVLSTVFAVACANTATHTAPTEQSQTSQPAKADATATAHARHAGHAPHEGACPAEGHGHHGSQGDREQIDADGVVRRGKPLTADLAPIPVSEAAAQASSLDGQKVKVKGRVASVCAKMGCWFVVQGDRPEDTIRISSKGHDIYVPRSAIGMEAVVEGELAVKVLDVKTAQHYEDERPLADGETPKTITAPVQELSIAVVGLEMRQPS